MLQNHRHESVTPPIIPANIQSQEVTRSVNERNNKILEQMKLCARKMEIDFHPSTDTDNDFINRAILGLTLLQQTLTTNHSEEIVEYWSEIAKLCFPSDGLPKEKIDRNTITKKLEVIKEFVAKNSDRVPTPTLVTFEEEKTTSSYSCSSLSSSSSLSSLSSTSSVVSSSSFSSGTSWASLFHREEYRAHLNKALEKVICSQEQNLLSIKMGIAKDIIMIARDYASTVSDNDDNIFVMRKKEFKEQNTKYFYLYPEMANCIKSQWGQLRTIITESLNDLAVEKLMLFLAALGSYTKPSIVKQAMQLCYSNVEQCHFCADYHAQESGFNRAC